MFEVRLRICPFPKGRSMHSPRSPLLLFPSKNVFALHKNKPLDVSPRGSGGCWHPKWQIYCSWIAPTTGRSESSCPESAPTYSSYVSFGCYFRFALLLGLVLNNIAALADGTSVSVSASPPPSLHSSRSSSRIVMHEGSSNRRRVFNIVHRIQKAAVNTRTLEIVPPAAHIDSPVIRT